MTTHALVIYHDKCIDGACAAWAAVFHLNRAGYKVTALPTYPKVTPEGAFSHDWDIVFVVDTIIAPADLTILNMVPGKCWVLDHHKTNLEALPVYTNAVFDMGRSGAGLAWDEVQRILGLKILDRPVFVNYVEDRDLWKFSLTMSKAVSAGLALERATIDRFEALYRQLRIRTDQDFISQYADIGDIILRQQETEMSEVLAHITFKDIRGVRCGIMNSPVHQSDLGSKICNTHKCVGVIWYARQEKGQTVAQVSFRSNDHLPAASDLAVAFGGGGHRNAAGAAIPMSEWLTYIL